MHQQAAREHAGLRRKGDGGARRQGQLSPNRQGVAGSTRAPRRAAAARLLPDRSGVRRAGGPEAVERSDGHRHADLHRHAAQDAARRLARVLAERTAAEADGVRGGRRAEPGQAVRAVQRSVEHDGDVSGRPLHRSRSHENRRLRDRLQPSVPSVLLLQPDLGMSVPAAGEPPQGSDSRRRKDEKVRSRKYEVRSNLLPTSYFLLPTSYFELQMPLRAIVFDFDGVLANSEPLHLRAFQDVLAEEHVELREADYYARYLGYDDVGVFQMIGDERGAGWQPREIAGLVARTALRMEALERDRSVLFPGAADAVRRAASVLPVAIASG